MDWKGVSPHSPEIDGIIQICQCLSKGPIEEFSAKWSKDLGLEMAQENVSSVIRSND